MFISFSLDQLLVLIGPLYLSGVELGVYLKMDTKKLSCLKEIGLQDQLLLTLF